MLKKRKTREIAMQVLFVWDANGSDDPEAARQVVEGGSQENDIRQAAIELATAAWKQRELTDPWVERIAPQWPPRRQPGVDRALIRLAVWEMTAGGTPPKVAIDEAIELAKQFSTEQSPSFVNGVLDAVLREQRTLTGDAGPTVAPGQKTEGAREGSSESVVAPSETTNCTEPSAPTSSNPIS
jgi:N utilization substance protein B